MGDWTDQNPKSAPTPKGWRYHSPCLFGIHLDNTPTPTSRRSTAPPDLQSSRRPWSRSRVLISFLETGGGVDDEITINGRIFIVSLMTPSLGGVALFAACGWRRAENDSILRNYAPCRWSFHILGELFLRKIQESTLAFASSQKLKMTNTASRCCVDLTRYVPLHTTIRYLSSAASQASKHPHKAPLLRPPPPPPRRTTSRPPDPVPPQPHRH